MIREIDTYYYSKNEPVKSCLLALRSIILETNHEIIETRKWSMPCFTFKRKMFCFLRVDKKTEEPYILFVKGNQLEHPKLEQGNRSKMKILRFNPNKDLPIRTIQGLLSSAIELHKEKKQ